MMILRLKDLISKGLIQTEMLLSRLSSPKQDLKRLFKKINRDLPAIQEVMAELSIVEVLGY